MFEVLVAPHRRRILDLLRGRERTVGDLISELGLSQPGVSKHLRVLRQAGLVEVRADGQRRRYRLRTEPLREIDEWLAPYRAAWTDRLDTLEASDLDGATPPAWGETWRRVHPAYVTALGPEASAIGPPPGWEEHAAGQA